MKLLAHYLQKQLVSNMERLNHIHDQYVKRSYELDATLLSFLDECKTFFKQIGASNDELRINELISYFHTAKSGCNPHTLEKMKTGRRDNLMLAAFYCMNEAGNILKLNLENVDNKLLAASETLTNVLLSIIQSGRMTTKELFSYNTIDQCESLWRRLIKDPQIDLVDKKLKASVTGKDIYLLLDKIMVDMQH